MARVAAPVWAVSVLFEDNNAKTATTGFALPATLDYDAAETRAIAIVAAMDDVSNARIVSFQISRSYREDLPVSPPPESEVQRKLAISLDAGAFANAVTLEIPSHLFTIEQDGTDVPVLSSTAMTTLLSNLTAGGLGAGNGIVTYYGQDVTRVNSVVSVHRDRGKGKK